MNNKLLKISIFAVILLLILLILSIQRTKNKPLSRILGASITANFPTSLDSFAEGDIIEEEDMNAIQSTIGITNSTDTSSHDYWIRHGSSTFSVILNDLTVDFGMSAATTTLSGLLTTTGLISTASSTFLDDLTVKGNATSVNFYSTNFGINSEYFTDLTGTGLQNIGGFLTLNATGDWTGTLDGFEGSVFMPYSYATSTYLSWANATSTYLTRKSFFTTTTQDSITTMSALSITETQISDLTHYADGDVDSHLSGGVGIGYSSGAITFDCSEVEGTGIDCATEAITLDATGAWTGTLDGLEGSVLFFVTSTQMASDDFGDFTCNGTDQGCTLDTSYLTVTAWYATDTDALTQGSTNLYNQSHTGDVTGATALTIGAEKVLESMLDINSAPTLNYVLGWNGSKLEYFATTTWDTDTDTTYSASNPIVLNGTVFGIESASTTLWETQWATTSVDYWLTTKDTGDLTEGTELYYTDARVNALIDATSTLTIDIVGNASTATALAANGANCNAGEYALGVNASGAVESCTDATAEINSVVNGLGGTNLTCASQSCTVDDAFLLNTGDSGSWLDLTYGISAATATVTTITGALTGNADTAAALASNPTDCSSGNFATAINASGDLTCAAAYDALTDITLNDGLIFRGNGSNNPEATSTITINSITGVITFPNLLDCDTFDTDGIGNLSCGTDATGAGGESNWQFTGANAITPTTTVGLIVNASSTFLSDLTIKGGATTTYLGIDSITGSTQCLQINTNGFVTGTGASCGGATAWDDITNPDANDEIDVGVYVLEMNFNSGGYFRLGDGGSNYWEFATSVLSNAGTATLTIADGSDITITTNADAAPWLSASGDVGTGVYDFGGATSFEIPNGAAPVTDTTGEIALDTTTGQVQYHDGTAERAFYDWWAPATTIASTTWKAYGKVIPLKPYFATTTVVNMKCFVEGGTSAEVHLSDAPSAGNDTDTLTCTTGITNDDGSIPNATFNENEKMYLIIGTVTGAVNSVTLSVKLRRVPD